MKKSTPKNARMTTTTTTTTTMQQQQAMRMPQPQQQQQHAMPTMVTTRYIEKGNHPEKVPNKTALKTAPERRAPPSAGVVMVGEDLGDRGRSGRASKSGGGGGGGDDGCCDRAQSLLDRVPPCTCEWLVGRKGKKQCT